MHFDPAVSTIDGGLAMNEPNKPRSSRTEGSSSAAMYDELLEQIREVAHRVDERLKRAIDHEGDSGARDSQLDLH